MIDVELVRQCLNNLGSSPNDIAKSLYESSIRGYRNSCGHCPIANYIKIIVPNAKVCVGGTTINIDEQRIDMHYNQIERFIKLFDQGSYQELAITK